MFFNLIDILDKRADDTPQKRAYTFLVDGETVEETYTYAELADQSRELAGILQKHGLSARPVAILLPQGLGFIRAFYGCLYAGAIAVPVTIPGKNRGADKVNAIVRDAGIQWGLTSRAVYNQLQKNHPQQAFMQSMAWILVDEWDESAALACQRPPALDDASGQQVAYLQYTSGSTGNPKGVIVTHRNIMANSEIIRQCFHNTDQTVSVCWLPSFHDMGLLDGIIQPVYTGFHAVLMTPAHFLQRPVRWLKAISRYQATYSGGPNFAFDHCVNRIKPDEIATLDLRSLRCLYNGAEPIRAETMRRFVAAFEQTGFDSTKLLTCYGLAEATLAVTMSHLGEPPVIQDDPAREGGYLPSRQRVSSGRPRCDTSVSVRNPQTGAECADGEVGEIWVAGASISPGYWNNPAMTNETFPETPEGRFLRTGDLGYLDGEELYITSRLKDLIIIHGTNHYPQDIEHTLEQCHPALQPHGGVAFSIDDDGREQVVIVQELVRSADHLPDYRAVFDRILEQLMVRHELAPYEIVLIRAGTLSKTTSGKVQRSVSRDQYLTGQLTVIDRWRKKQGTTSEKTVVSG